MPWDIWRTRSVFLRMCTCHHPRAAQPKVRPSAAPPRCTRPELLLSCMSRAERETNHNAGESQSLLRNLLSRPKKRRHTLAGRDLRAGRHQRPRPHRRPGGGAAAAGPGGPGGGGGASLRLPPRRGGNGGGRGLRRRRRVAVVVVMAALDVGVLHLRSRPRPNRWVIDAPCLLVASHGASIRPPAGCTCLSASSFRPAMRARPRPTATRRAPGREGESREGAVSPASDDDDGDAGAWAWYISSGQRAPACGLAVAGSSAPSFLLAPLTIVRSAWKSDSCAAVARLVLSDQNKTDAVTEICPTFLFIPDSVHIMITRFSGLVWRKEHHPFHMRCLSCKGGRGRGEPVNLSEPGGFSVLATDRVSIPPL
jgi:hypothetical protein